MAWLCGLCGSQHDDEDAEAAEREPLLAQYDDETARQRRLHAKLHSYQMVRALGQGYMPSTSQAVANLRTLLAGLEQPQPQLSSAGRALLRWTTRWLQQLIALAQHKNSEDQLQDFAWYLARSRVSMDVDGLVRTAERAGAESSAQATGAFQSLKTVGSLLLTNTDFRLFLTDLTAVGRDIFRDTAVALSDASRVAAENVDVQKIEQQQQQGPGQPANAQDKDDSAADDALPQAQSNLADVAGEVAAGATKVAAEATQSATDKLVDNEDGARDQLLTRLQQAVARLRQRPDYSDSVSLLTVLLQRYATAYVRVVEHTAEGVVEEVEQQQEAGNLATNDEVDAALRNFWSFVTSFGDAAAWTELAERFHRLLDRVRGDGTGEGSNNDRINDFILQVSEALQDLLTDPAFFDHIDERLDTLRKKAQSLDAPSSSVADGTTASASEASSLQQDVGALLEQTKVALAAAARDKEVSDLVGTTGRLADVLWPSSEAAGKNAELLLADAAKVFVPLLFDAVQHVPIPRLEIATPDVDLLLENVVLEPGHTVHHSSFLPYQLHVQVRNDVDVYKGRVGGDAGLHTAATIHVKGLSVAVEDVGYVLRLHAGPLLRLTDEGIASVRLDERGIDVQIDVAVVRDDADTVLALRSVRVHVHHLDYALRQSRAAWLLWLLKPLVRPLLRRTLEQQLAATLTASLQGLNRELVFARERLRAARIATSGGGSGSSIRELAAFVRAVTTRFSPSGGDPDTQVTMGLRPDSGGVFQGVYAPGSLMRVWDEEARQAQDQIETYERGGWRNAIFDVPTEESS